jgi:hypothetical protein
MIINKTPPIINGIGGPEGAPEAGAVSRLSFIASI